MPDQRDGLRFGPANRRNWQTRCKTKNVMMILNNTTKEVGDDILTKQKQ